jgi:putative ABC transport system permease protein
MTPLLVGGLFALTVAMCVASALAAIMQVMRVDPAIVFSR